MQIFESFEKVSVPGKAIKIFIDRVSFRTLFQVEKRLRVSVVAVEN